MVKNSLKFLSLALVMFFIIAAGGCGGGHSGLGGSGGSGDAVEALNYKSFESPSGFSYTGTTTDGSTVTMSDLKVNFSNIKTAALASVQTAAMTAAMTADVKVSYMLSVNGSTPRQCSLESSNVEITETSSGVYAFKIEDLSLTIDPDSKEITFADDDTEYSNPIPIKVESKEQEKANDVTTEDKSASIEQEKVLEESDLDSDDYNTPDILDFDDVYQKTYGANDTLQDIIISSIPSRHSIENFNTVSLATDSDDINSASFKVGLTAGIEYTVEISESAGFSEVDGFAPYAAPIGNNVPDVEIINPYGTALTFLDFGTFDENYDASEVIDLNDDVIELSYYPSDNPYMICYTFTPSVTGTYTINLSATVSDDAALDAYGLKEATTLFIYQERRSGTDENEAGYFKRYKIKDEDGNAITVSMNDIMSLRSAYNDVVYNVLSAAWETDEVDWVQGTEPSDEAWKNILSNPNVKAQVEAYYECLARLKDYYGIFDDAEDIALLKAKQAKVSVKGKVSDDTEAEAEEDAEIEKYKAQAKTAVAAVKSAGAVSSAAAQGTKIKQELYGIPYTDDFQPGTGYFGVTGVQSTFNAVRRFELETPTKKKVKSNYKATFVSSQEEREKLSTTTAGASLSIGGFGLGASYSSGSTFKFGLTSTTFVIHYEELETSYRTLDEEDYKLKKLAKEMLQNGDMTAFRNAYGDYFVGGYKYGGTYDAFITITTSTMEQIEEVKTKLSANFATEKGAVSAEVGNTTKDTLRRNNASVSIEIKTAGIDVSKFEGIKTGKTTDINDVVNGLAAFKEALKKSTVDDFTPAYVMLKRYTLLDDIEKVMRSKNYDGALVPISPEQSAKILAFNRQKMIMDSYYSVISDLTDQQISSKVRNDCKNDHDSIEDQVGVGGNAFYLESNTAQMDSLKRRMDSLGVWFKALGDRYVFYQILMSAQNKEDSCASESDITKRPFGSNGGYVGKRSFAVSTAVTSDIAAGSDHGNTINKYSGKSWEPTYDAGSGKVFCYVGVTANNTHDVTRTADRYCIGSQKASFHFTCGVARWLEWKTSLRSMRFNSTLYPFNGLK